MACWRVLELFDPPNNIPQLLIKTDFGQRSYTVYVTDLSNIWSEELDLDGIVRRASDQESPIEASRNDTAQLKILLDNVQQSLESGEDSTCQITNANTDGIVLNTTVTLPRPLGLLAWVFHLEKRPAVALKHELILPLLVSSHIQHERITGLIANINEKDRAITRLIDQYESSGLDLTSAFPSIAGSKSGKRVVKREQAARHVPALQSFEEERWKMETSKMKDDGVSTLEMFQEALSQCAPHVPGSIKSEDVDEEWWGLIPKVLSKSKPVPKPKEKQVEPVIEPKSAPEDDETETEDEFETHANFKLRDESKAPAHSHGPAQSATEKHSSVKENDSLSEDDDDDLDAPPRSQSQRSQSKVIDPQHISKRRASPSHSPVTTSPPKRKGFRIGGAKAKKVESPEPPPTIGVEEEDEEMLDAPLPTRTKADTESAKPKSKKTFKIGGKSRAPTEKDDENPTVNSAPRSSNVLIDGDQSKEISIQADNQSTPSNKPSSLTKTATSGEEHEETAEEKAERKRAELKRKNEELAKKQGQKKKKRF